MIEVGVYTLIIGKIIEESHKYFNMTLYLVLIGDQMILYRITRKDVQTNINAGNVMDGKNLNITLKIIRLDLVHKARNVKKVNHVLIII